MAPMVEKVVLKLAGTAHFRSSLVGVVSSKLSFFGMFLQANELVHVRRSCLGAHRCRANNVVKVLFPLRSLLTILYILMYLNI
jgi:hypothetical protein